MEPVTRSQFFATAATASGAAILLAACSDDTQSASDNGASSAAEGSAPVIGLISSDLYASPNPQRVAFAIAQGASFIDAGDVNVTFKDEAGTVLGTSTASYHGDGLPKNRGIYVCEATLTSAGTHTIHVETTKGTQPQDTLASVTPVTSATPVNVAAPKAASPTPTDTLGVQPICTRTPACTLHEHSLSEVIGNGKPTAVLFATPARCQSQYCGPVLDIFLDVLKEPAFASLQAVHVEIYKDDTSQDLVPTLDAWHLQSEPWLYCVNADGTIVTRLDGGFDRSEIRAALQKVV